MKCKAVGQQHRLHRPLYIAKDRFRDLHSLIQFPHELRFDLEDRKLLFHDCGAIRITDVTHDLLAATAKTKFVIGAITPPFRAHKSLVGQRLQVVGCQSECVKRGELRESLVRDSMIVAAG